MEVMLAPCPAENILDLLMERKEFALLRSELQLVIQGAVQLRSDLSATSTLPLAKKVLGKVIFSPQVHRVRVRFYMMYLFSTIGKLFKEGIENNIGR